MSYCSKCGKKFSFFQKQYYHVDEFGNKIKLCYSCYNVLKLEEKQRKDKKSISKNENDVFINTEKTHRKGEEQYYINCPNCGTNVSIPEEYRNSEKFVCFHCKKSFKNPRFNTGRTPRIGEPTYYLNCPNCGKNVSISEKNRNDKEFVCYYCKKSFKNPQIPKKQSFNFEIDEKSLELTKSIVKTYYDKCDTSTLASISTIYEVDELYELVANDNLVEISNYIEKVKLSISKNLTSGTYDDLDESMILLKTCEEQLDFLIDLEKIYKLIYKKGGNVSYPVILKLFNDLYSEELNGEINTLLKHEHLRIEGKLFDNISIRDVLKEFIKTPLDIPINVEFAKKLLEKFDLEFNEEELEKIIEELKEEIDLEDFEHNLGKDTNNKKLPDYRDLNGIEFEIFLKKLFEILGYTVIQTKASGDQGADLVLMRNNLKTVVQAKKYSGKVSNKAVQEVVAAKKYYKCDYAMVVTTGKFTKGAIELAISNEVELWDSDTLSTIINDINNANNQ